MRLFNKVTSIVLGWFVSMQAFAAGSAIPMADDLQQQAQGKDTWSWGKEFLVGGLELVIFGLGAYFIITNVYGIGMNVNEWRKKQMETGELLSSSAVSLGYLVVIFVIIAFANAYLGG